MQRRIYGPNAKGEDFLDKYKTVLLEIYESNITEPIYQDVRFFLPMVIPNFSPGSDDIDLVIRDTISKYFFDEADEIWKEDLRNWNQGKPITNKMDDKLRKYFSRLRKLLLEKSHSQLRENPDIISSYFK
ncbi:MAG: hypothetical protein MI921_13055 [Cytophagales bacterium]|nr:hypothetical protein [Cytophagales bacterium]